MSDNPFDQFDDEKPAATADNPFDQFDEKEKPGLIEGADNLIQEGGSALYHGVVGGYKALGDLATGKGAAAAADTASAETAQTYHAPDSTVGSIAKSKYNPLNWPQALADRAGDEAASGSAPGDVTNPEAKNPANWTQNEPASPLLATILKSAPTAFAAAKPIADIARNPRPMLRAAAPPAPVTPAAAHPGPALTPEEVVAKAGASQSMGAASAPLDISGVSPETRAKIAATPPDQLNTEALARQVRAETLPLPDDAKPAPLRKDQAVRDAQMNADVYNMRDDPDTGGHIRASMTNQSTALGQSIGEIQRRATPDVVARTTAEHDQTAIDAIKSQDNAMIQRNRSAYKDLADANGGALPIDKGALGESIDTQLDHEYLRDTVDESSVLRPIMSSIRSPNPLTFQRFESIRSRLAEVMREGGSDGAAARIVRSELEAMPLTEDAASLKGLADKARAGAKSRFDWIDQNPAVEAAVNDNVPKKNGLHVIGAKSPQAGGFLDRFATGNTQNASAAYVERLKQSVPNPDLHDAIEGATLNKLRDTAGIDPLGEGTFKIAPFSKAVAKMGDKAPILMKPETVGDIKHLKGYADDVGWEGVASGKNRSNTGSMLARFGALQTNLPPQIPSIGSSIAHAGAEHVLGNVPGGKYVHGAGDFLLQRRAKAKADAAQAAAEQSVRDAKLKFAQDATAPGAGIDWQPPAPPPVARATGGKAGPSDEELVARLMSRWKKAKRESDASTKPLLGVPDESIIHALKVSGAAL